MGEELVGRYEIIESIYILCSGKQCMVLHPGDSAEVLHIVGDKVYFRASIDFMPYSLSREEFIKKTKKI